MPMQQVRSISEGKMIGRFSNHQTMRGFSRNTVRRRRWTLTRFGESIRPRQLGEATRDDVEAFLSMQASASTRQALLSDIRTFYRWATDREVLEHDPTARMDKMRVPKRRPSPLSVDEFRLALESAEPRTRLMLMLSAYAGLRVAEVASINIRDIDRQRRTLMVRQGKGGKDRELPLADELAAEIQVYGKNGALIGMTPTSVSRLIRDLFRELGIEHRPHDLRHLFGTESARRSNGNLVSVAALMGHETMTTTQRYVGWSPDARAIIDSLYGDDDAA